MGSPETAEEDPAVTGSGEGAREATSLEDLPFVGAATAATLSGAGIAAEDIDEKSVSYRELVDAGVNPGVAGKLRREHSLHWTHDESAFDLDRRSKGVRGLRDGEREWVASTDGVGVDSTGDGSEPDDRSRTDDDNRPDGRVRSDDRSLTEDGAREDNGTREDDGARESDDRASAAGESDAFAAEAAWRERATSPGVGTIEPVPDDAAATLESAGVETVRQLATANVNRLATELGIDRDDLDYWQALAGQRVE